MKKFLSLVLALVMTMSLVTVSAGAKDFTDSSKINYAEAVDVLSDAKVIDGYAEGDFRPTATLTRGAAAKIICNLILGPTTAGALVADAAPYKDVPTNNTFAGYIAYCQKAGIISGYADGTFKPANSLTGYAFMKMLLGALGYDASREGYTGPNWSIAVGKRALNAGLADDLVGDFNGVKAVTREEACLYAFNTLKATMVEYDNNNSVTVNGITFTNKSTAKDMKSDKDKKSDETIKKDGLMQFAEKYFTDLKKTSKGNDAYGRPATEWKNKNTVIGTYADTADYVFTAKVSKKDLYNTVGKDVYDDLTAKTDATKLTVWVDGDDSVIAKADIGDYMDKNSTAKIGDGAYTGNGVLTEVTVDDDNNVTIVIINTYVLKATDDYSSKKEEVAVEVVDGKNVVSLTDSKLSADDFDVADVKEDDYILATGVVTGTKLDVKDIAMATVETGKVTSYSNGKDVTLGGTTYKYNENISEDADNGKGVSYAINEDATVVLDAYGYIIYVDEAKASSNDYVYIREFAKVGDFTNSKDLKADAVFADGTRETIVVKNDDVLDDHSDAGWYTYTKKSSGKYELTDAVAAEKDIREISVNGTDVKLTENGKSYIGNSTTTKANKSTTFVVFDDGDVNVYTGISNVPTIKTNVEKGVTKLTAYAVMDNETFAKYVYIDATNAKQSDKNKSSSDKVYLLDFDRTATDADDNEYYQYNAIVNGEETKIKLDADEMGTAFSKANAKKVLFKLYDSVRYDAKTGYVTDMDVVDDDDYMDKTMTDAAVDYKNGVLTIAGEDFVVADSYKIYLVVDAAVEGINDNDDDWTVSAVTASGLKAELKGYEVDGSFVSEETDDELVALYVHVSDATPVTK